MSEKFTVGELRKLLEGQPDDAEVLLTMDDGCCGDFMDLTFSDASSSMEGYDKKPGYIAIRARAVPGYSSCIQSGGTKRAAELYWRRNKSYVERTIAGHKENLQEHIKAHAEATKKYESRLSLPEWLGFSNDEWKLYNDSSVTIPQILKARHAVTPAEKEDALTECMRQFGQFRRKLRNALGRAGIMSNPGWTEDDISTAVEQLADKRLEEAPPVNKLKLGYLRQQAKEYRGMSTSQAKEAAKESDHEKWDMSRIALGQAWAFEQMIGYTRGLNHRQIGIAARKGKL